MTPICSTNGIEFGRRYRSGPGPLSSKQAVLKCLNVVTSSLDPAGKGAPGARCAEAQISASAITFGHHGRAELDARHTVGRCRARRSLAR